MHVLKSRAWEVEKEQTIFNGIEVKEDEENI